jgi:single-strand DNA-binding protein
MKLIGIARIGKDFEVRYAPDGAPVGSVICAWNFGKKDANGKQASQWAELALWGDRAEKLAPYLLKGQQVFVDCSDVRIELYERRDGKPGYRLLGRIDSIEFGARPERSDQPQQTKPTATTKPATVVDMDDDPLPF